jgi:ElaB/YqjD/DUF883 family membrane-anchored ribosome-binding protein
MENRIDQLISGIPTPKPRSPSVQSASEASGAASAQFARLRKKMEEAIAGHPVISLSVGLAIGATLGWLLKRK